MEAFQKSTSVLWETGNYLAQLERENELIEKQLQELLGTPVLTEEETIKQYDLPYRTPSPPSSNRMKTDRESLYQQQVSYLENRIENYIDQIKSLENTIKEKDNYISQLEKRPQRAASPMREIMRDPPVIQTVFAANLKRREKELERKIVEYEKKMGEERKAMQRLQNLNRNLLGKFKEAQERESDIKGKMEKVYIREARANNLIEENQHLNIINRELHEKVEGLTSELSKMHENYNLLLSTSIDFEEKSQELYHLNQVLNQKLQTLLKNN
ncbi:hypothetical protein SteCoe_18768 [Stentor coeruleus]|uniref:DUF4201 domain-containing protein n=1 Tax=Stentor coeruleus TaxID=5963 RepID=A0A1R2BVV6_9CILI|nr:hypothetical protein SteCoe_18768 [Stentor coeruleus]